MSEDTGTGTSTATAGAGHGVAEEADVVAAGLLHLTQGLMHGQAHVLASHYLVRIVPVMVKFSPLRRVLFQKHHLWGWCLTRWKPHWLTTTGMQNMRDSL
jgi:hypothetical protein